MGYSNIECGNVVVIAHPLFTLRSPVKENLRFPSLSYKIARSAEWSCGTKIRHNSIKKKGNAEADEMPVDGVLGVWMLREKWMEKRSQVSFVRSLLFVHV